MKALMFALIVLGMLGVVNRPVYSQLFQNGQYYASPSWDQQIPAAQRFIVLSNWNNQAVLDRETGLVWERSPASILRTDWFSAISGCEGLIVANRLGWRLPSPQELASLIDPTQTSPALPAGNPFQGIIGIGIEGSRYWSAATTEADASSAKAVEFSNGSITALAKIPPLPIQQGARFWCVRGSSNVQTPQ